MTDFRINAEWDNGADVWVATSPDVPGLVLEARTHDDLIEKVRLVLPALIEIGVEPEDRLNVTFHMAEESEALESGVAQVPTLSGGSRDVPPSDVSDSR